MAAINSKVVSVLFAAALAVFAFAGGAFAADAPAPSPTSGAGALSTPIAAALLCSLVALLIGSLRH